MKIVICAACKVVIGYSTRDEDAKALAKSHGPYCTASEEQYEQAKFDMKFREITEGLDL